MKIILFATLAFVLGEALAIPVFARLRGYYAQQLRNRPRDNRIAIAKGVLERVVLYLGLLLGYAVILAAFGAFKLGTRLKQDNDDHVSNDYFLVGNMMSLLIVLIEILLCRGFLIN